MMIVRLFCPQCAYDASKRLRAIVASKQLPTKVQIEVPVPVARVAEEGEYEVRCGAGHVCQVTLDNLSFELLFDVGLNALIDGYPRDAVSSFAAALERFQEFYWQVVMAHFNVTPDAVGLAWKPLSGSSERQLGGFVTASLVLTRSSPPLLNPNKEVAFRNRVIHKGYLPSDEEAVAFGNSVMSLMGESLRILGKMAPEALLSTYARLSPAALRQNRKHNDAELHGTTNVLTAIDARRPPKGDGPYVGSVTAEFERIAREREPHRMQLLTEEELRKQVPDFDKIKSDT